MDGYGWTKELTFGTANAGRDHSDEGGQLMDWRERIERAITRGRFLDEERALAMSYATCAIIIGYESLAIGGSEGYVTLFSKEQALTQEENGPIEETNLYKQLMSYGEGQA